ncbi:long-chain-fatty-acid--CoA ligase ACSBG2-like [Artemia franciscana]|uniref:long-chain-fatty-acid--CoA ligase n=1 Tax=Artemia franciscana TaxID=6661 RepID=A0AA88HXY4_ARTSF|nr:hypothetical protein QYM36_004875 [Artemia franciscana]
MRANERVELEADTYAMNNQSIASISQEDCTEDILGSDQRIDVYRVAAWDPTDCVKRSFNTIDCKSVNRPTSVLTFLEDCTKGNQNIAFSIEKEGKFIKYTYSNYLEIVNDAAKAFLKLGLEPLHSVFIISNNCPEWCFSHFGAITAGGIAVGISTNLTPELISRCAQKCRANFVIVENKELMAKVLKVKNKIPRLKAIIQVNEMLDTEEEDTYSWETFLSMGRQQSTTSELIARRKRIEFNACCSIVYEDESGDNPPKGVMLSHINLTENARLIEKKLHSHAAEKKVLFEKNQIILSLIPLSHVNALMTDVYVSLINSATVHFLDISQREFQLTVVLKKVRPTVFFANPFIWEKLYEKITDDQVTKKKIADLFKNQREGLGLDKCINGYSGGERISQHIIDGFKKTGLQIWEYYGMSETCGPHLWAKTAGNFYSEMDKRAFVSPLVFVLPSGQLRLSGKNIFMGYLCDERRTTEAIDKDGSFHSGDLGHILNDFLLVSGNQNAMVSVKGRLISPLKVENEIKSILPFVRHVIVESDSDYISVKLFLNDKEPALTQKWFKKNVTKYTDRLRPTAKQWFKTNHIFLPEEASAKNRKIEVDKLSDVVKLYQSKDQELFKIVRERLYIVSWNCGIKIKEFIIE